MWVTWFGERRQRVVSSWWLGFRRGTAADEGRAQFGRDGTCWAARLTRRLGWSTLADLGGVGGRAVAGLGTGGQMVERPCFVARAYECDSSVVLSSWS